MIQQRGQETALFKKAATWLRVAAPGLRSRKTTSAEEARQKLGRAQRTGQYAEPSNTP